jgi:hypothetical protein
MPFGVATVVTNGGKRTIADRLQSVPTRNPFKWIAMGVGATAATRTAVAADTALSTEVETRTSGSESTVTTAQTGDTYQVVGTVTATATRVVDESGLFGRIVGGQHGHVRNVQRHQPNLR